MIYWQKFLDVINDTGESVEDVLNDFVDYCTDIPLCWKVDKDKIIKEFMEDRYEKK